jgi:hypothetical protein
MAEANTEAENSGTETDIPATHVSRESNREQWKDPSDYRRIPAKNPSAAKE